MKITKNRIIECIMWAIAFLLGTLSVIFQGTNETISCILLLIGTVLIMIAFVIEIVNAIRYKKLYIYTRDKAALLVDMFEKVLMQYDIHVPSPEDDERDADDFIGLYGSTYSDLLDNVENFIIDLFDEIDNREVIVITDEYSGTI